MKIEIIQKSVLKGKGIVKPGQTFTEKDADPVELTRMIAYGKAKAVNEKSASGETIEPPKPRKGLSTQSAGALK